MASSTDLGSSAATRQVPLYSNPSTSSVVSNRFGIVLYRLGAPSESSEALEGGVAHCTDCTGGVSGVADPEALLVVPAKIGVWGW